MAAWTFALLPAETARAAKAAAAPKHAAMIVDANTGKVLHDDEGDAPRFPASLTKMMTLYMLFGEIEQGRVTLQSKILISERANGMAPSKLGLEPGSEITVLDCIKALVVKSANDIAVAVGEHLGGSEYQFARMMTARAREIGMARTTFFNASGLPNPRQVSTARDMITLALRLYEDYPQYARYFALTSFEYGGKVYKSHNTLMRGFPGMDGVKTGYTRASGFNLVSSVRTDGKHVVGAVFGGKTAASRNALMRTLLVKALERASPTKTRKPQNLIARARGAPKLLAEPVQVAQAPARAKPPARATAAATVPLPVRVVRPAPAKPARDPIGEVLAAHAPVARLPDSADTAEATAPPPRLDLNALRAAMSEAAPADAPPVRTADASAPSAQDIAGLIRNSIVDGASQTGAIRQPSTLEAQANALGTPDEAVRLASAEEGSTEAEAGPVGKGFEIQIGAFTSPDEAQSKIERVRQRAVALLEGHDGVALPVQKADRQIFRARFVNFDETSAASTCLELRRLAIDCLVIRAE